MSKMSFRTFCSKAKKDGFPVTEYDTSTDVKCPRPECNEIVVYNGNYFCRCGWAAPERNETTMTMGQLMYMDQLLAGLKRNRGERAR